MAVTPAAPKSQPTAMTAADLTQIVNLSFSGQVRFGYEGGYVSKTAPFTVTAEPVTWTLREGRHQHLRGYWICQQIERKCWQIPNPAGVCSSAGTRTTELQANRKITRSF